MQGLSVIQSADVQDDEVAVTDLINIIEQLRDAIIGLAEREFPDEESPCFCVQYKGGSLTHDQWCEDARHALAETNKLQAALVSSAGGYLGVRRDADGPL